MNKKDMTHYITHYITHKINIIIVNL